MQGNDRQLAELHFKTGLTLHFLNQPAEGLQEVRKAISICEAGLQDINTVRRAIDCPCMKLASSTTKGSYGHV